MRKIINLARNLGSEKKFLWLSRLSFLVVTLVYGFYFLAAFGIGIPYPKYGVPADFIGCYVWNDLFVGHITCQGFLYASALEAVLDFFLGLGTMGWFVPLALIPATIQEPMLVFYFLPLTLIILTIYIFSFIYVLSFFLSKKQ